MGVPRKPCAHWGESEARQKRANESRPKRRLLQPAKPTEDQKPHSRSQRLTTQFLKDKQITHLPNPRTAASPSLSAQRREEAAALTQTALPRAAGPAAAVCPLGTRPSRAALCLPVTRQGHHTHSLQSLLFIPDHLVSAHIWVFCFCSRNPPRGSNF